MVNWKEHFLGLLDAIVFIFCLIVVIVGWSVSSFGLWEICSIVVVSVFHLCFVRRKTSNYSSKCLRVSEVGNSKFLNKPIKIKR